MSGPVAEEQELSIGDVARLAKVSSMTVSRVINDSAQVSLRTRERVERAMSQLNYRPNPAAQALSSGRSRTIGVVTMEGAVEGPTSTLAGIEQDARDLGYAVTVSILQRATPASIAARVRISSNLSRRWSGMSVCSCGASS